MKISGYAIERIHKNMYRIINTDGQQVGIIERNKQASVRPGTGRWHARGTSKLSAIRDSPRRATTSAKRSPSSLSAPVERTSLVPN